MKCPEMSRAPDVPGSQLRSGSAALWLVALGVFLGYNAGIWTEACGLWQRNGDAERDGSWA